MGDSNFKIEIQIIPPRRYIISQEFKKMYQETQRVREVRRNKEMCNKNAGHLKRNVRFRIMQGMNNVRFSERKRNGDINVRYMVIQDIMECKVMQKGTRKYNMVKANVEHVRMYVCNQGMHGLR